MTSILKKGGVEGGCFRRSRSANSVPMSGDTAEVIPAAAAAAAAGQAPQQPAEPLPGPANAVKNSSEVVACHAVDSTEESLPKSAVVLQRSVSEKGIGSEGLVELQCAGAGAGAGAAGVCGPSLGAGGGAAASTVFPSLPDAVLKTMGLLVNGRKVRETLSEDDVENRFTSLSLAFKTDQLTLGTRMELQKRQRDQAESNMAAEVSRLKSAVHKLNRVYVDAESIENLTQIQTLVDILQQATDRVSSSAEMFGAVQQEQRLSTATEVLMTHVENVKRSMEKIHVELEEVKRVLADNNIMLEENSDLVDEPTPRTYRYRSLAGIVMANKKVGSKRRASIAAMPRECVKGPVSPQVANDNKSRMANVVNAMRRKTSLSPSSSQSSLGAEIPEWAEQGSETMEEIQEVLECHGMTYIEEKCLPNNLKNDTSTSDTKCQHLSLDNADKLMVSEVFLTETAKWEEELVKGQTDNVPNAFQTILKEVKRKIVEAQFQMTDMFENNRSVILEKLRWSIATILIGLAACLLVWVIFPSADAAYCTRQHSLHEFLL